MKTFRSMALAGLILAAGSASQAAVYNIDPSHSEVGFRVRHLVSKVRGSFKAFSGTVDFDEKNPAALKVDAVIQSASVYTNEEKRDGHLRSADFFNVEKFPTMTFKSTSAKAAGNGKVQLTGNLTLLGVTKPVTLDVELLGVSGDPWGNTRSGFSATGKLNRKDYGMVFNIAMDKGGVVLGDEVEILLEVETIKAK